MVAENCHTNSQPEVGTTIPVGNVQTMPAPMVAGNCQRRSPVPAAIVGAVVAQVLCSTATPAPEMVSRALPTCPPDGVPGVLLARTTPTSPATAVVIETPISKIRTSRAAPVDSDAIAAAAAPPVLVIVFAYLAKSHAAFYERVIVAVAVHV